MEGLLEICFLESFNCKSNITPQSLELFFQVCFTSIIQLFGKLSTWKLEVWWWDTLLGLVSYFVLQEELSYFLKGESNTLKMDTWKTKPNRRKTNQTRLQWTPKTTMKGERMQINLWTDSSELVFSVDNTEFVFFFHIWCICLDTISPWNFFAQEFNAYDKRVW